MKVWKNKKGVSPVIATILMVAITVVLAAVLYVMVMGMMTGPGTVNEPLGVVAKYVSPERFQITVSKAPANVIYDGCTISLINGSTSLPVQIGTVYFYKGGAQNISTSVTYTAATGKVADSSATKYKIEAGDLIVCILSGTNYVSPGDSVQITGTGFSTTTAQIVA
ncbi:MAG: archaellin/type IV pilin N-terminal domain-containing protein [Thermoplasmata archaeon]